jgi:hypothetical protein
MRLHGATIQKDAIFKRCINTLKIGTSSMGQMHSEYVILERISHTHLLIGFKSIKLRMPMYK